MISEEQWWQQILRSRPRNLKTRTRSDGHDIKQCKKETSHATVPVENKHLSLFLSLSLSVRLSVCLDLFCRLRKPKPAIPYISPYPIYIYIYIYMHYIAFKKGLIYFYIYRQAASETEASYPLYIALYSPIYLHYIAFKKGLIYMYISGGCRRLGTGVGTRHRGILDNVLIRLNRRSRPTLHPFIVKPISCSSASSDGLHQTHHPNNPCPGTVGHRSRQACCGGVRR